MERDNPSDITTNIAVSLKYHRQKQNLSQMSLSEMADVHFTYYSQIERGLRKDVSVRVLKKIVDALGITLNDVVD